MDIIRQKQHELNLAIWHFKIGGIAADGLYRLADFSEETTSPEDWLAANPVEAQAAIDAGEVNEDFNERVNLADLRLKIDNRISRIVTVRRPDIATGKEIMTNPASTQAQKNAVLNGLLDIVDEMLVSEREQLEAWKYVSRRLK